MRVLLIDLEGLGLDFALRCAAAGHQVRWFRIDGHKNSDGLGFKDVTQVDDWYDHMDWAKSGIVLNTSNQKFLRDLDEYRDDGYPIFSPSAKSAALEVKRSLGMELMKKAGIDLPPYHMFNSLEEASAFARKSSDSFVFKTMGDEIDKSLAYVSKSPADMVGWIDQKVAKGMKLKGPCMLQEKIDMLCDYGVSGWFGPDGFLKDKWQICFEHKKLMNGEIGPNTGEQGTVTQYVEKDPLVDMLMALEEPFKKAGHIGDTSIGVGVDKKGKAWPFEFTMRLGYPAWWLQMQSHEGDPVQWMKDLLDGKDTLKVSRDVCTGVVCAQPPYPSEKYKAEEVEGSPICYDEKIRDHLHPCQIMLGKGPVMDGDKIVDQPMWQTSGPYVLVATALGPTLKASQEAVYDVVDQVSFPNMMYRTDIGDKVAKALPELHKLGFAKQMKIDGEVVKKPAPAKPAPTPAPSQYKAAMMAAMR